MQARFVRTGGVADLRSFVIVVGFSQAVTSIPQTRDEVKETMF